LYYHQTISIKGFGKKRNGYDIREREFGSIKRVNKGKSKKGRVL
jgi:hypothetical protein